MVSVTKNEDDLSDENRILVIGKSDDSMALKYLNFLDFSKFGFTISNLDIEKSIIKDSLRLDIENIEQPQLMDLIAFSQRKSGRPYYSRVLFTPGDSIFLNIENGEIRFYGDKASHYNFFIELNDPLRQDWAIFNGNSDLYKNQLFNSYKKKDSFFRDYITRHKEVSKDFINIVGSELKYEYLYHLIRPINTKNKTTNTYSNDGSDIIFLNHITRNSEDLFDLSEYFEDITIEDFKRPDLINNDYFKRSLVLYIRHYFSNHDYLDYSRSSFYREKECIEKNLSSDLKTYAIGRLIKDYYSKGFGQGKLDHPILRNTIMEYLGDFKEASLINVMNEILDDLDTVDYALSEDVLSEKLIRFSKGDTLELRQILSSKRTKVIDFWATWCILSFLRPEY
ncbi:MAG: hypothetical protein AAFX55_16245, partial [Bacteroidota bacterium]